MKEVGQCVLLYDPVLTNHLLCISQQCLELFLTFPPSFVCPFGLGLFSLGCSGWTNYFHISHRLSFFCPTASSFVFYTFSLSFRSALSVFPPFLSCFLCPSLPYPTALSAGQSCTAPTNVPTQTGPVAQTIQVTSTGVASWPHLWPMGPC